MQAILDDLSPSPLLNAMEANIHEAWIRLGRGLGAMVHNDPELLWFHSGLPFHLANGIVKAHFPSDTIEETLAERLKQLTAHHLPMAWLIGPSTHPTDLGSHLQQHGWMLDDTAPGMALDLCSLDEHLSLPSQLTIKRVSDEEMLKTWLRVMTVGSELPEEGLALLLDVVTKRGFKDDTTVHYYLGLLGNKPVASSLLYLGAGVAGIYNVATLPEARHQGIGTALTLAPLLAARAQGYRIGTLQATPMGLNLYHRLGFRKYCTFHAYFSPEEQ